MALHAPGAAEAEVGDTDSEPSEEGRETGQRNEPVEHGLACRREVDVGDRTPDDDGNNGPGGARSLVDEREALGSVAEVGEGDEGAATAVHARHAHGKDRDENGDVDKV